MNTSPFAAARIMIVDDDVRNISAVSRLLRLAGYPTCIALTDPTHVTQKLISSQADLLLLDLHMEPLSGLDILDEVARTIPVEQRPPILVLTGDDDLDTKRKALASGATDFLSKPIDEVELLLRIQQLLLTRSLLQQSQEAAAVLERKVEERTAELKRNAEALTEAHAQLVESQQQLIDQERIRALGTMASGIAHDLNNSLSIILGYGDLLLSNNEKFPVGSEEQRFLQRIVTAGTDNANMVNRLREFYRPNTSRDRRGVIDINELVKSAVDLTEPRWKVQSAARGARINLTTECAACPAMQGNQTELREVLVNLIFNAVDAMPSGGQLKIQTRAEKGNICLEVTDNGEGMTEEVAKHCMDPFFTTKRDNGTGLGLSMSFGIVRRHGGKITIESELGKGTTFKICLPQKELSEDGNESTLRWNFRPLRILVVDDQINICEIMQAYLGGDGHEVVTELSARSALRRLLDEPFDLVITDRLMEKVNGDEFAATAKRCNPERPIILMTGFVDAENVGVAVEHNVDYLLEKPAQLAEIRHAIAHVMLHLEAQPHRKTPHLKGYGETTEPARPVLTEAIFELVPPVIEFSKAS